MRYPDFRSDVDEFYSSGELQTLQRRAVDTIIADTVGRNGYRVAVGLRPVRNERTPDRSACVDVVIDGDHAVASVDALGFGEVIDGPAVEVAALVRDRFGEPTAVELFDVGPTPSLTAELLAAGGEITHHRNYPARV
jgi:hypothetical protein